MTTEHPRRSIEATARPWLSPGEFATLTGFHPESVRRMIRRGRLPATRFGAKSWRIHRSLVQEREVKAIG